MTADDEDAQPLGGSSQQLGQAFYDRLARRLGERIADCGDRIPVITGTYVKPRFVSCSLLVLMKGRSTTLNRILRGRTGVTARSSRARLHRSLRRTLRCRSISVGIASLEGG